MNKEDIRIDYADGKFRIKCPFWANDSLNGLIAKRWNKKDRDWSVPSLRANLKVLEALLPLADFTVKALDALKDGLTNATTIIPQGGFPLWYKFKTEPLAHQRKALNKAYGQKGFALHMCRGTGKSKVAIDIASALYLENKITAVLVLVRRSLRFNWMGYDHGMELGQREGFIGHCPLKCDFHLPNGGDAKAMLKFKKWLNIDEPLSILIMSIESLSLGDAYEIAKAYLRVHPKVFVIIDESSDIANHSAVRSKKAHSIGMQSAYRMTCTGTPISTGPMNLYSQFEFLDPDIIGMGDFYAYRNRYAIMGGFSHPKTGRPTQIIGYRNMDELAALVAPYVYECQKSEVLDLPPKVYERRYVQLTAEQSRLYKQIKKDKMFVLGDSAAIVQNALELALRLQQITGGIISHKVDKLEISPAAGEQRVRRDTVWKQIIPPESNPKIAEVLSIAEEGKPTIIWCVYRMEIAMVAAALKQQFPNEEVLEIHGGIDERGREEVKQKFQSGQARLLVGNTASGGVGLTLTACEIMVYFNNSQRMIDRLQSEDRAHRHGLTHSVLYIDLIAENTVDVTVMEAIEAKVDLAEYVRLNIRRANELI